MNVEMAKRADIGGRNDQQDRVAVFARRDARLLVLADGLGGYEGGAVAAQAVIDTAKQQFNASTAGGPADLLTVIATGSHERINTIGDERGTSPHSTCVLLHLRAGISTWLMSATVDSIDFAMATWWSARSIIPWSNSCVFRAALPRKR